MKNNVFLNIVGWILILLIWFVFSNLEIVSNTILPTPTNTFKNFIEMLHEDDLGENIMFSLKINFLGYLESILIAIPIGFILGLSTHLNKMFSVQIDSMRFVPITALGGLFVALSGLTIYTKIHFLAFGIMVYLIPVVVQRISEIDVVHIQMMQTLGATKLQTFVHLQFPYVISRLSDDVRILVGISWTYIIVAELKNVQGGLGSLIFLAEKQSNIGMLYAVVIIIITIGILQDKIFKWVDKLIFRWKYA